jgi:SAM-dependent MidA family methyltransferase
VTVAERLRNLIHREGPLPFDRFVDIALYDPEGFFGAGRGPGRAGRDFVTSPEIGSLFGALVARALDEWWSALDRPDPYVVVDAGAGTGRLARDVLRVGPACAPALRYLLVERSAALRAHQREHLRIEPADEALGPFVLGVDDERRPVPGSGPVVAALDDLPALELTGVVVANELLDNLPFGVAQRAGDHWEEVLVGVDDRVHGFVEVLVPASAADAAALDALVRDVPVPDGQRFPLPRGIDAWLRQCATLLHRGLLLVIDYVDSVDGLVQRGSGAWLRTYREHRRGASPLDAPGAYDITADVISEQLHRTARDVGFVFVEQLTQAEWLTRLGAHDLAAAAREALGARGGRTDLDALAARSRVSEAAALTDPAGLGAHTVVVFAKDSVARGGATTPG